MGVSVGAGLVEGAEERVGNGLGALLPVGAEVMVGLPVGGTSSSATATTSLRIGSVSASRISTQLSNPAVSPHSLLLLGIWNSSTSFSKVARSRLSKTLISYPS